ncbi:MAG: hypothetical protein CM15mP121_1630 [Bacteroidota bacterium]|nr:MAG: hypothetical protein CM15mP121_1630 [Bacteroidota bacterium]
MCKNSKLVVKEALSETELIDFEGWNIRKLEFGRLRTLIDTMKHVPNMFEKTFDIRLC